MNKPIFTNHRCKIQDPQCRKTQTVKPIFTYGRFYTKKKWKIHHYTHTVDKLIFTDSGFKKQDPQFYKTQAS